MIVHSHRKLAHRKLAVAAASLAFTLGLAGCMQSPQEAALNATKSPYVETVRDEQSCGKTENIWEARYSVKGDADSPGKSLAACFKTRHACHVWLDAANGSTNGSGGEIIQDQCTKQS